MITLGLSKACINLKLPDGKCSYIEIQVILRKMNKHSTKCVLKEIIMSSLVLHYVASNSRDQIGNRVMLQLWIKIKVLARILTFDPQSSDALTLTM